LVERFRTIWNSHDRSGADRDPDDHGEGHSQMALMTCLPVVMNVKNEPMQTIAKMKSSASEMTR
jgi:hypothetical protein